MTKVRDIITLAKATSLSNLSIKNDEEVMVLFVRQGVEELYRRFNLSVKTEVVETRKNIFVYTLSASTVNKLLTIFYSDGSTYNRSEILDGARPVFKTINTKEFMLTQPDDGYVIAMYAASAPDVVSADDELPIPKAFEHALLMYISYLGHSAITVPTVGGALRESDVYQNRFLTACETLIMEGFRPDLFIEDYSIQSKGFV